MSIKIAEFYKTLPWIQEVSTPGILVSRLAKYRFNILIEDMNVKIIIFDFIHLLYQNMLEDRPLQSNLVVFIHLASWIYAHVNLIPLKLPVTSYKYVWLIMTNNFIYHYLDVINIKYNMTAHHLNNCNSSCMWIKLDL